ncbi:MAG: hypothetical protein E6L00_03405 [Thaumarchaeota archaeon]|nr:MAG: hypothetical protein E6L00_03405 [Nitrososphaerota archaeon]
MQSFSYYLADESPCADGMLWSTLVTANDSGAKLLICDETKDGLILVFDKEINQSMIADLLYATLATEDINTH